MIFYITFNDYAGGVYASQVVDTVSFLNNKLNIKTRIVAFISIRGFFRERKKIKSLSPSAIVVPMFPGVKRWRMNSVILFLLYRMFRPKISLCRGVFAFGLANKCRKQNHKLVFDARGAYHAEFSEYKMVDDENFIESIKQLECDAIKKADKCLAVSKELIGYWFNNYAYNAKDKTQVIPCTVSENFLRYSIYSKRSEFNETDIVICFSGSSSGWQSESQLVDFLVAQLQRNSSVKVLLLSKFDLNKYSKLNQFKDRITIKWVKAEDMPYWLSQSDYGILIREETVTNKVSSPVKFGEYLSCGCKVLISENVGDFTEFVRKNKCGLILNDHYVNLEKVSNDDRIYNRNLAEKYFSKENYIQEYNELLK